MTEKHSCLSFCGIFILAVSLLVGCGWKSKEDEACLAVGNYVRALLDLREKAQKPDRSWNPIRWIFPLSVDERARELQKELASIMDEYYPKLSYLPNRGHYDMNTLADLVLQGDFAEVKAILGRQYEFCREYQKR